MFAFCTAIGTNQLVNNLQKRLILRPYLHITDSLGAVWVKPSPTKDQSALSSGCGGLRSELQGGWRGTELGFLVGLPWATYHGLLTDIRILAAPFYK